MLEIFQKYLYRKALVLVIPTVEMFNPLRRLRGFRHCRAPTWFSSLKDILHKCNFLSLVIMVWLSYLLIEVRYWFFMSKVDKIRQKKSLKIWTGRLALFFLKNGFEYVWQLVQFTNSSVNNFYFLFQTSKYLGFTKFKTESHF